MFVKNVHFFEIFGDTQFDNTALGYGSGGLPYGRWGA